MSWRYTLHDAAGILGLKKTGSEYHGPCPVCGGNDRFFLSKGQKHDILASCRHGCSFGDIAKELINLGVYSQDPWDKPVISQEDKDLAYFTKLIVESERTKGALSDKQLDEVNNIVKELPPELQAETRASLGEQQFIGTKFEQASTFGWDWQVKKPSWLMDRLIPAKSLGMVFGASNAGKSHWVCDFVMAMLEDQGTWLEHDLKGGAVAMFSESLGHIQARLQAYKNHRRSVIRHPLYLANTLSLELHDLATLRKWLESLPERPRLLIFDTLATAFAFEENDNGAASTLIGELESICRECLADDATLLIVHHTAKASNGLSARGASALIANIDWSVQCSWDNNLERTIVSWEKDRWRLLDEAPKWEGRSTKVPVYFKDESEPYEMRVLTWDKHDPLAVEAAEQRDRDQRLQRAQEAFVAAARVKINDTGAAVFRTNRRAKLPTHEEIHQVNAGDVCEKDLQTALSDWISEKLEVFQRETLYTKTGIEVGVKLK